MKTEEIQTNVAIYIAICKKENICPIANVGNYDFENGAWFVVPDEKDNSTYY